MTPRGITVLALQKRMEPLRVDAWAVPIKTDSQTNYIQLLKNKTDRDLDNYLNQSFLLNKNAKWHFVL